jgi:hypothetical protein
MSETILDAALISISEPAIGALALCESKPLIFDTNQLGVNWLCARI